MAFVECVKSRSFHADWNILRLLSTLSVGIYFVHLCTQNIKYLVLEVCNLGSISLFLVPFHRPPTFTDSHVLNKKITSSEVVPTEENSITGPQTLWHWRTNYRIRPVTFSLHICQSRSSNRSENCHVRLARKQNNSLQRQLSHHF